MTMYDVVDLATCNRAEALEFAEKLAELYEDVYDVDVEIVKIDEKIEDEVDKELKKRGFEASDVVAVVLYCDRLLAVFI